MNRCVCVVLTHCIFFLPKRTPACGNVKSNATASGPFGFESWCDLKSSSQAPGSSSISSFGASGTWFSSPSAGALVNKMTENIRILCSISNENLSPLNVVHQPLKFKSENMVCEEKNLCGSFDLTF